MFGKCRLVLVLVVAAGCSSAPKDEFLSSDQLPAVVATAADGVFPGLKCDQVWKYEQDGETVYELRGKTPDGKSHETTISAAGKVLWPIKRK